MLGPASSRRLDEPLVVSLEALVRASNFYRHLEATLDLSFVRDWLLWFSATGDRAIPAATQATN